MYAFFVSRFKCGCRGPLLDLLCRSDSAIFRPTTALYASRHVRIRSKKVVVTKIGFLASKHSTSEQVTSIILNITSLLALWHSVFANVDCWFVVSVVIYCNILKWSWESTGLYFRLFEVYDIQMRILVSLFKLDTFLRNVQSSDMLVFL